MHSNEVAEMPLIVWLRDRRLNEPYSGPAIEPSPATDHQSLISDSTALFGLMLVWSAGVAFFLGRACLGRIVLLLFGMRGRVAANRELLQRVGSLARSLKLWRGVRVIESARLTSPIAFGFVRPTIGLPLNFVQRFSVTKQEAMLTHELAHLAAHDPFWHLFADFVAGLLWWHPAIWLLRRQLHLLSEVAADEASLMMANGPRVLAECLVEMGAQLTKPAFGQLRVAGFRSALGARVERLMRLEENGWRPVSRGRALLARSFGPTAVAGIVIFCTAWAVPEELTKGDGMKTMKKNWQRVFATFATMAAIQSPTVIVAQPSPAGADPAPAEDPAPANSAPAAQNPPAPGAPRTAESNTFRPKRNGSEARYGLPSEGRDRILANRASHGFGPFEATPYAQAGQPENPQRGGRLEARLREIVLDEVTFDNLPLSEVLKFMSDESRKRDPEKKGINFLIDPNAPQNPAPGVGAIDPATGLPVAAPATEAIDIGAVSVRFNIPLRHVTMADVLDAIVRVADKPIQYAVEDYAVIFLLRPEASAMPAMASREPGPTPLTVQTFHVDTNTFVAGLESAFGIKVDGKGKGESQSRKIQSALRELLAQLNVTMDGNKAIFYNELTGTVMARLAPEDLQIVQAAIVTLGGEPMGNYAMEYMRATPQPGFRK
jgi:beta-lactamase regulating signal transducer with metallopeptidase domain